MRRLVRLFSASLFCAHAQAQVGLSVVPVGPPGSFLSATCVTQPPGESRRLFVALREGTINIVRDGVVLAAPALSPPSDLLVHAHGGLLGMAFDPEFQANGFVYILYTATAPVGRRVVRYTLDPTNPESADPASAHPILTVTGPGGEYAGWIGFGTDGCLYISTAAAAGAAAQDLTNWLGKILRVDVRRDDFPSEPGRNYAVPPTNPFAGSVAAMPEIWALGLRNPWRCSIDRGTGDLWVGDVGDLQREEVNRVPAASAGPSTAINFGWPCMEGIRHTGGCDGAGSCYAAPVFEYGRVYGQAIIGGYVYRGAAIPALRGDLLFGDLSGRKWTLTVAGPSAGEFVDRTAELPGSALFAFGEDASGELYVAGADGVYKVVPRCAPNCDGSTGSPALNVADFTCFLHAFAAGDPYANCDGSTQAPTLAPADFACFARLFAAGCP